MKPKVQIKLSSSIKKVIFNAKCFIMFTALIPSNLNYEFYFDIILV